MNLIKAVNSIITGSSKIKNYFTLENLKTPELMMGSFFKLNQNNTMWKHIGCNNWFFELPSSV